MTDKASTDEIRLSLKCWLNASGWSKQQVHRGMRGVNITDVPSVSSIEKFLIGIPLCRPNALGILRFIEKYPNPPAFHEFEASIPRPASHIAAIRESDVIDRIIANEQKRAEYVRRQLADEHKPKPRARSILFGLEKDVVAALSGARI